MTKLSVENELFLFKGIFKYKIQKILQPEKYKESSHYWIYNNWSDHSLREWKTEAGRQKPTLTLDKK